MRPVSCIIRVVSHGGLFVCKMLKQIFEYRFSVYVVDVRYIRCRKERQRDSILDHSGSNSHYLHFDPNTRED